ncbi:EAL domain-containing protein [Ureibacillus sp. GCM10028918]|uniref:sensor domain-containing protein n=1 Tax=Ureibacillus sp. GCM10028918 TaxID=3273429 RepID=UPI00361D63C1
MHTIYDDSYTLFAIYKSLFESNPDPCYALDKNGKFVIINKMAMDLAGYTGEEFSKFHFSEIVAEEHRDIMLETFKDVLNNGTRKSFDVSVKHKTGIIIELYGTSVPIIVDNKILGIAGIVKDMTQKNQMQRELERTKNELENVFNNIDVCVWSSNFEQEEVFQISSACKKIYGYTQEEFKRNPNLWTEVIHPDDCDYVNAMQPKLAEGLTLNLEYRIIDANQNTKWISNYTTPIFNESGDIIRLNGVVADIQQRRIAEEQLEFMAFNDELTQLPNRRRFEQLLNQSILNAIETNTKMAVLYFDVDQFKWINDTLGHTIGDKVLKVIAERLRTIIGEEGIVSRVGGDEFIILLKEIEESQAVEEKAQNLIDEMVQPIILGERSYVLTASIGISMFPDDTGEAEKLIIYADQALNEAKRDGKNTYKLYRCDFSEGIVRKLDILQALRQAIKSNDSLTLNYQPIVDACDKRIVGFEALLRWNDPTLGVLSPAEFIPIAEESGLIIPLGEWVIRTACTKFNELYKNSKYLPYLSVNVSTKQFDNEQFVPKLMKILEETNFNPEYLKIELTESIMMRDVDKIIEKLNKISELGIGVFLDDFGTGYSSLSYLGVLPINTLKIDRSFIQNINNLSQEAIVRTIISMANSLEKGIIAEGVEEEHQLLYLQEFGCHHIQGYIFGKPVPFDGVLEMLKKAN